MFFGHTLMPFGRINESLFCHTFKPFGRITEIVADYFSVFDSHDPVGFQRNFFIMGDKKYRLLKISV